jgi:hypothetical protein
MHQYLCVYSGIVVLFISYQLYIEVMKPLLFNVKVKFQKLICKLYLQLNNIANL